MARRKTCLKCGRDFTDAQYRVHKFTHLRDQALQKDPADLPTSRLLPIEVPEEDAIMAEDTLQGPTQSMDDDHTLEDDPFSDDYNTSTNPLQHDDPFSDDHTTLDNHPLTHSVDTPPPLLPSASGEEMDISPSPSYPGDDDPGQHSASPQPSLDRDIGFEDSVLDPAFAGQPSLSEQLKENFLRDYHGGGGLYSTKHPCTCLPLNFNSKELV